MIVQIAYITLKKMRFSNLKNKTYYLLQHVKIRNVPGTIHVLRNGEAKVNLTVAIKISNTRLNIARVFSIIRHVFDTLANPLSSS